MHPTFSSFFPLHPKSFNNFLTVLGPICLPSFCFPPVKTLNKINPISMTPEKPLCYSILPDCSFSNFLHLLKIISYVTLGFHRHRVEAWRITKSELRRWVLVPCYPRVLTTSADLASDDLRCKTGALTAD